MVSMESVRGVVFDLDGTLVDSYELHQHALGAATRAVGMAPPGAARVFMAQRATDVATVAALTGTADPAVAWAAYHEAFLGRLAETGVRPTDGTGEALRRLREAGIVTGVCTGRTRKLAEAMLAAAGLAVDLTVAREDAGAPKPAPDGLRLALSRLGLSPGSALFVGDSPADRAQGQACGVRTVLTLPANVPGLLPLRGARP
jgi:HAD superfamily hydrolase (TIGR01509 family)